jgi:hypothetical protein
MGGSELKQLKEAIFSAGLSRYSQPSSDSQNESVAEQSWGINKN